MGLIKDNVLGVCLVLLAIAVFSFTVHFKKLTVLEDGENISPKYYKPMQLLGLVISAVLIIWQFDVITDVFLHSIMSLTNSGDARVCVLTLVVAGALIYIVCKKIGIKLRNTLALKKVAAALSKDSIVEKLLQDASNGANEISIYQNRAESIRSYDFDIAGYNHPAFSEIGAYLIGLYINKRSGSAYTLSIVKSYAGEGRSSQLNVLNNGARYKFSHVYLQR